MDPSIFVQLTVIHIRFLVLFFCIFALVGSCRTSMEIKIRPYLAKTETFSTGHWDISIAGKL